MRIISVVIRVSAYLKHLASFRKLPKGEQTPIFVVRYLQWQGMRTALA
jgi:hypothetical protein